MSAKTYDKLVWGFLVLGAAASFYFLTGCASPDPPPPIAAYRAAYGFSP